MDAIPSSESTRLQIHAFSWIFSYHRNEQEYWVAAHKIYTSVRSPISVPPNCKYGRLRGPLLRHHRYEAAVMTTVGSRSHAGSKNVLPPPPPPALKSRARKVL